MPGPMQAGQLWIDVGMDTHALDRSLSQTQRSFGKTLNSMKARMKTFATNMTRLWHTSLLGFAAFGVAVGSAVSSFSDLEQAQTDLAKRMNVGRDAIEGVTNQLTQLSMTMPTTRKELTEIAVSAAQVGVARENIAKFVQVMKQFEIATGRAADEAAKDFKRIMNVTGEPISNVENLGSELATLVDQFPVADVETIMQVMIKMGRTVGAAMDVSSRQLASLSVMVSSMAKRAARPASQMRKLFTEMATDTQKFAKIAGVSMETMTAAINEGPVQAVVSLIEELREIPGSVQRFQEMADVSRTTAKAIAPLIEFLPELKDALREGGAAFKSNTELMADYNKEMENLSTQLKVSWGNFQTFIQTIGEGLAPALRDLNKNVLKPFTSRLVTVVNNSDDARDAIAQFILTGLKITGLAVAVGALAKMFAFLLGPIGMAITSMVALWAAWELNIYGVRDGLQDLRKALKNLLELDFSGFVKTLTEAFQSDPLEIGIPLFITGFTIARLAGVSATAMIGGALATTAAFAGVGANAAKVALVGGAALAITIPLMIEEFTNDQKIKKIWEASGLTDKIITTIEEMPLTVSVAAFASVRWGGLIWSKFSVPIMAFLTNIAAHIPFLGELAGVLTIPNVLLTAGVAGFILSAWQKAQVSAKSIAQQVAEGIIAATAGAVLAAAGGTLLGVSTGGAFAIGIVGALLVLELTKLIPKLNLGDTAKEIEKETNKIKQDIKSQVETKLDIKLNLEEITSTQDLENVTNKIDSLMDKSEQWSEDQFEKMRDMLESIRDFMEVSNVVPTPDQVDVLRRLDKLLSKQGYQQGGEVEKFQKGGMAGFVPGSGSGDIIPAMLEPGEFVWPSEMVSQFPGIIKGMWDGFKKGGPVSSGTHYYGPGPDNEDTPKDPFKGTRKQLKGAVDQFSKWLRENAEDQKKANKVIGNLNTIVDALFGSFEKLNEGLGWTEQQIDRVNKIRNRLEKEIKGLADTISEQTTKLKKIEAVSDAFERAGLDYDETEQKLSLFKGNLEGTAKELIDYKAQQKELRKEIKGREKQISSLRSTLDDLLSREGPTIAGGAKARREDKELLQERIKTQKEAKEALEDKMDSIKKSESRMDTLVKKIKELTNTFTFGITETEKMVKAFENLTGQEEISNFVSRIRDNVDRIKQEIKQRKALGMSYEEQQNQLENLKQRAEELGWNWNKLIDQSEETITPLDRFADALGVSSNKLQGWINSIASSFTSLIDKTGVLSDAESVLMDGMISVGKSLLQGNYVQALIDGITSLMDFGITRLKTRISKLEKKLDAAYSMVNDALRDFGSEITSLVGGLLGPFDSALSGAIDGFTSFVKATQQGAGSIESVQSVFQGLLSIATGLISSFTGLLQRSSAWQQLQNELEPLWQALANALNGLIMPIVALVDWVKEYLGIAEQVNGEVKDLNIAEGFKRQLTIWENATPGQAPMGDIGGGEIPTWAKTIIKPMKDALMPILDNLKGINLGKIWQNIWTWLATFFSKKIPQAWNWLQGLWNWVVNNAGPIWNKIKGVIIKLWNWFKKNFPDTFEQAINQLGEDGGMFDLGGMEDKLEDLKTRLKQVGSALVMAIMTATGAIVGAIAAQWIPFFGAIGGALAGAALGLGLGSLMGNFPELQSGGTVLQSGFAKVHKGEVVTDASNLGMSGNVTMENVLVLDGKEIYRNQKQYEKKDMYRESGSETGSGFGRS